VADGLGGVATPAGTRSVL